MRIYVYVALQEEHCEYGSNSSNCAIVMPYGNN